MSFTSNWTVDDWLENNIDSGQNPTSFKIAKLLERTHERILDRPHDTGETAASLSDAAYDGVSLIITTLSEALDMTPEDIETALGDTPD